jgi:hypothetical protein
VETVIPKELFEEQFQNISELMGWRIGLKRARLIYDRIKYHEVEDLKRALDIISSYENFDFHKFESTLNRLRAERRDDEERELQKEEKRKFLEWWHLVGKTKGCLFDYKCYKCSIKYCNAVAIEAIKTIKDVLSGKIAKEQINERLLKFQGLGWDSEPF